MKTLDEVIKGFECCKEVGCGECPYKILFDDDSHVPCDQFEKDDDALQWLKGYKAHIELDKLRDKYGVTSQELRNTSQITCPKCNSEFVILPDANNPLTWDELKTMEGKPVWVEADDGKYKGWVIVGKFYSLLEKEDLDAHVDLYYFGRSMEYSKEMYGYYWQAYKKERK